MSRFVTAIAAVAAFVCFLARAEAAVLITVDKSAQRLSVAVNGVERYEWPVSTARRGYRTPNGTYRPQRLERKWFSREYDWSPMPYSIFFAGGYAIHGSYEISRIGSPASHGCIRLHPDNAAILFKLVQQNMGDTSIVVTGEPPAASRVFAARPRSERVNVQEAQEVQPQPARRGFANGFGSPDSGTGYATAPDYRWHAWTPADDAANAAIARKRWDNLH
jgi:L,D-transpeptidase catalytic domain